MRILISTAAALLMSTLAAFAADPVGSYTVKGTNPGNNGTYSGRVTVTKTGETYSVIWVVGSTRYVGTGIGNRDFIAVSYKSDEGTGLALYGADGGNWAGVWTYSGGRQVGAETWSRN
ncbi:MAG: hypothetical protein KIT76_14865 [Pseudolabrys sp.]|jgi:hypothetical protein|nr:hypothetical protein [Pseudolabrys sp.]